MMGTSDRLYELACECRDEEESLERVKREVQHLEATARAAGELADAVEDAIRDGGTMPIRVRDALHGLRQLG